MGKSVESLELIRHNKKEYKHIIQWQTNTLSVVTLANRNKTEQNKIKYRGKNELLSTIKFDDVIFSYLK